MIQVPQTCAVNRYISKRIFYNKKSNISLAVKKDFARKVKKIVWKYKISEYTIGIPKTEEIEEIQVFEINLQNKWLPKNALRLIDRLIPYAILYEFVYGNNICYGIALKKGNRVTKYYFSEWNNNIDIRFYGENLKICYQNIITNFINSKRDIKLSFDFESTVEIDINLERLERKIKKLERKIKKKRSSRESIELFEKLVKLKDELSFKKKILKKRCSRI